MDAMTGTIRVKKLQAKEGKCLAAVKEIATEGYDPSMLAVAFLLRGDETVQRFDYLKTYGCLSSLSVRKVKTILTRLLKNGYLRAYAPFANPERYLTLTDVGEEEARKVLAKNIRRTKKDPAAPLFNERN